MKKEDIEIAAINIIGERGLSGFSMRMILEQVECSEALIYSYFPSKDSLLMGCFEYLASLDVIMYQKDLPAAIYGLTDPVQIARKAFYTLMKHHQKYWRETTFYLLMTRSKYSGLVNSYLERAREEHFDHMFDGTVLEPYMKKISDIMTDGVFHQYLGAVILGPLSMMKDEKKGDPKSEEMIVDILFNGINSVSVRKERQE